MRTLLPDWIRQEPIAKGTECARRLYLATCRKHQVDGIWPAGSVVAQPDGVSHEMAGHAIGREMLMSLSPRKCPAKGARHEREAWCECHERAQDEVDESATVARNLGRSRDAGCCPLEILMGENDS